MGLISKKKSQAPSTSAAAAASWQGEQWEYRAIALDRVAGPSIENVFNGRAVEGFELVAMVKHGRNSDGYAVFKRPKGGRAKAQPAARPVGVEADEGGVPFA